MKAVTVNKIMCSFQTGHTMRLEMFNGLYNNWRNLRQWWIKGRLFVHETWCWSRWWQKCQCINQPWFPTCWFRRWVFTWQWLAIAVLICIFVGWSWALWEAWTWGMPPYFRWVIRCVLGPSWSRWRYWWCAFFKVLLRLFWFSRIWSALRCDGFVKRYCKHTIFWKKVKKLF